MSFDTTALAAETIARPEWGASARGPHGVLHLRERHDLVFESVQRVVVLG